MHFLSNVILLSLITRAAKAGKVSMKGSLYINSLTVLSIIMLLYVIYK